MRHNASVTTSHAYHVVCFSVFTSSQASSVHQDVVQLLLCTFGFPVCNLFLMSFLCIVLSAKNFCNISHCFNQSPLLFDSLRVEVSSHNLHVFFRGFSFSSQLSCTLFRRLGLRIPRLINVICCLLTVIDVAMARSLMYSVQLIFFSPLVVQKCCYTVFVFEFSSTHVNVSLLRLPFLSFVWSPCLGKQKSVPSAILSLESSDLVFFCSTAKVTLFPSSVSRCEFFSLVLRISLFVSLLVLSLLPHPSFASLLLLFTFFGSSVVASLLRMQGGTSPSMKLSPCLPPAFSLGMFFLLVFEESFSFMTTRSPPLAPASDPHGSTAHSRRDEFDLQSPV